MGVRSEVCVFSLLAKFQSKGNAGKIILTNKFDVDFCRPDAIKQSTQ